MGAIHSTKISGNFGPKLNGSVRSNRKSFEKTGPPFEVDHFSRSDRLEFWLNGSRPITIFPMVKYPLFERFYSSCNCECSRALPPLISHICYERDTYCHAYSDRFVTAFDLTHCSVLLGETIMALVSILFHLDKTTGSANDLSKRSVIGRYLLHFRP